MNEPEHHTETYRHMATALQPINSKFFVEHRFPLRAYTTPHAQTTRTHTQIHSHLRVHHVPHCMCQYVSANARDPPNVHHVPHCKWQCQGTPQHIFRHLCLPGVSGYVCVSAFLLPKEMETIPGPPEFYLVCPLIAGLRGKREGGREGGRREERMGA